MLLALCEDRVRGKIFVYIIVGNLGKGIQLRILRDSRSQTHSVIPTVKDRVELANENIPQNPEWSSWRLEVLTIEAAGAQCQSITIFLMGRGIVNVRTNNIRLLKRVSHAQSNMPVPLTKESFVYRIKNTLQQQPYLDWFHIQTFCGEGP